LVPEQLEWKLIQPVALPSFNNFEYDKVTPMPHPLLRLSCVSRFLPFLSALLLPLADVNGEAPAPLVDRVGWQADYASRELVRHTYLPARDKVITVFVNPQAAKVTTLEQEPYPAGSIIVFEWADPQKEATGQVLKDSAGKVLKGPITRIDVMRREPGYGAEYGEDRAGEWEFASYLPDGSAMALPDGAVACARCHKRAGTERDFVFAGRFPPKK
jgi:hypothetical protein